ESEQPLSRATVHLDTPLELECEQKKNRAADRCDHAIDRACKPECPGQLRSENKEAAVDQDLPRRCGASRNNRQHGNTGAGILISAMERESPERGRRPEEDDKEESKRLEPHLSGRRGPSDDRGQRAGGAADNNVL